MSCECDDRASRNYAKYYDTPDGQDIPTKAMVTARYGILAGLIMGTYDVMMYSHATGLGRILQRYILHAGALGSMGVTFAVVANSVQNYRQKNDELNYFLGGLACGPIAGKYLNSGHAVLLGGIALGVIGAIKKTAVDNGWSFIPDIVPHMRYVNSWRHDFSLVKDPKDEWIHSCGLDKIDLCAKKSPPKQY